MTRKHREPTYFQFAAACGISRKEARELKAKREEEDRFFLELTRPYRHVWRPELERVGRQEAGQARLVPQDSRSPSEILRSFGPAVLWHPAFWVKVWSLAQQIVFPFGVESDTPGVDERRNDKAVRAAKKELERVFRLLATEKDRRRPKFWGNERTLFRLEELREKGTSEKQAVAEMVRERQHIPRESLRGARTAAGIRAQVTRARRRLGKPKRPYRRRGRPSRKKN